MSKILTSIIITWKDRPDIRLALQANASVFANSKLEIIIVNCGGNIRILKDAIRGLPFNIILISTRLRTFNKCYAQNIGVSQSTGRLLLFLDADVIIENDFIDRIPQVLRKDQFLTLAAIRESQDLSKTITSEFEVAFHTELRVPGYGHLRVETNRARPLAGIRSAPGIIAMRREHFIAIGGANSRLSGWGWEDLDVIVRLQFTLKLKRIQAGIGRHLSHPNSVRILNNNSRTNSELKNFLACIANYTTGSFQGTYVKNIKHSRYISKIVARKDAPQS
jgi:predicted glycosyltransferase involved in capsule biosynthesis